MIACDAHPVFDERLRPRPTLTARVRHGDRLVDVAEGLEHRVGRRRVGDMVASPLSQIKAFGFGSGGHTAGIAIVARNLKLE